ncbi:MAG: hypothetical protein ACLQJR_31405 [Stellaceae bacterium]
MFDGGPAMYHVFGIIAFIIAVGAIGGVVRAHLEERAERRRP